MSASGSGSHLSAIQSYCPRFLCGFLFLDRLSLRDLFVIFGRALL